MTTDPKPYACPFCGGEVWHYDTWVYLVDHGCAHATLALAHERELGGEA